MKRVVIKIFIIYGTRNEDNKDVLLNFWKYISNSGNITLLIVINCNLGNYNAMAKKEMGAGQRKRKGGSK